MVAGKRLFGQFSCAPGQWNIFHRLSCPVVFMHRAHPTPIHALCITDHGSWIMDQIETESSGVGERPLKRRGREAAPAAVTPSPKVGNRYFRRYRR